MRSYNPLEKKNWASPTLLDGGRRTNEILTKLKTIWSHPFDWDENQYLLTVWEQDKKMNMRQIGIFPTAEPISGATDSWRRKKFYARWKDNIHV